MDIPEMAAEHEMAVEPQREAEQKEQLEEDEEHITLRRSDFLHFQDTLVDIRSQIRDVRSQFADFQRDVRQDRLEVQEMFRAIMDRLPPATGPHAPSPAP
jgi:septal ring factor EnvC (AmiA/AmiB activator)